ncbi:LOW QUALITY PROTEIN: uncharacterized protein LOC133530420 [Cydia pomonella]|uniref:LOW QUALITY PROTEIN: uncharacterized protein LOC133530420 n=1 Tax=Cydia pomonella TaxID=82600 RepID=UPI002ADD395C|nr:LOW QUALITY PROTEIN: uncharacterized protein LOC133530420 [Cydia pomonella]
MDTFLDLVRPLYVLSSIFCIRKYSVCDGIASTISPKEMLITISANCILIYLFYSTFQIRGLEEISLKLYYLVIYGQHVFSFVIISCHNMRLSKVFVALIKILQELYNFERSQLSPKAVKRKMMVACGILMYLYIGVTIPKLVLDPYWNWIRCLLLGSSIIVDFELVFIIFIIRFLALKFKTWSKVISKYSSEQKNYNCQTNFINIDSPIREIRNTRSSRRKKETENLTEDEQNNVLEIYPEIDVDNTDEAKKLFEVYNQLVNGTNLMKSAFQFTVRDLFATLAVCLILLCLNFKYFLYFSDILSRIYNFHTIISVHRSANFVGAAMGGADRDPRRRQTAIRSVSGFRNVPKFGEGCAWSQYPASRVPAARSLARPSVSDSFSKEITMFNHDIYYSVATTRSAKNALRLSSSQPCRFKAVGALPVDAALPLRLAALVGSYTVRLVAISRCYKQCSTFRDTSH